MTTATLVTHGRTMDTETARPRRSLEELVDQLFAAMGFTDETETQAEEQSATRSIHEARRLRQSGDVDGALAVLGGVDAGKATAREARWAFSEWKQLVKRRFGGRDGVLVYSQGTGRAAALVPHGGAGMLEAVAVLGMRWRPGKVVSGTQPAGPAAPGRRCVMVVSSVDIPTLKARHPLGDTVEAAGVRLRGRGRVRQGVCPFHDEAEGSVHGVRRLGALLLLRLRPRRGRAGLRAEVGGAHAHRGHRGGWTAAQGLRPGPLFVQSGARRPASAAPPPRDPSLLTAAARFYAGMPPAFDRSAGIPGLAGRRPGRRRPPLSRLFAGRRSATGP